MISIIVPIYNVADCLAKCIDSILKQTYSDFELILINDGSSDNSDAICKEYLAKDSRITYISKPNSGVGSTRNLGLTIAKGEWICFIDSDDMVKPDYLESFNLNRTNADLVISGIEFFDINEKKIIRKISFDSDYYHSAQFKANINKFLLLGFPYGKAYKKEFIDIYQIKFPEDISFHEDHVFVLDYLLNISSIETSSKIGYIYNIDYTANSLSKKKHPWEALDKSGNYMLERIDRLKRKFDIPESSLVDIYTFCYEPKISAIYSLYDSETNSSQKRNALRQILECKYPIEKYFYPAYRKGKLIKYLVESLPFHLLHYFFKAVHTYQRRHK